MRLGDLFDIEKGPAALVKLAVFALVLVIVFQAIASLFSQISSVDLLMFFVFLIFMSPIAHWIREARLGHSRHEGARRGAERTPLLPPSEEGE
jgi:hypothetical protein